MRDMRFDPLRARSGDSPLTESSVRLSHLTSTKRSSSRIQALAWSRKDRAAAIPAQPTSPLPVPLTYPPQSASSARPPIFVNVYTTSSAPILGRLVAPHVQIAGHAVPRPSHPNSRTGRSPSESPRFARAVRRRRELTRAERAEVKQANLRTPGGKTKFCRTYTMTRPGAALVYSV